MKFNAGKITDFEDGAPVTIRVASNFQVVLVRKENRVFAINDECPHMGGPLGEGEVEDNEIICPWHFWRFNIETGECTDGGEESAACYPVTIEDEDVFIEVPDNKL